MTAKRDIKPSVSVITPTFNAAGVIERAVRSVAAQTFPVHEHLIIDDGSTDDTAEVIRRLRKEILHLKYIYQPSQGAAAARNKGIEIASGKYIAFVDSDDSWKPEKLMQQIGFMESTDTTFTYGAYHIHEADSGNFVHLLDPPDELSYQELLLSCPIGCLTAAYNQYALGKIYMPDVKRGQDWGLWLALTRNGLSAKKYPGIEAIYYKGRDSLSSRKLRKLIDLYRIYRCHEGLKPLPAFYYLGRHAITSVMNY